MNRALHVAIAAIVSCRILTYLTLVSVRILHVTLRYRGKPWIIRFSACIENVFDLLEAN